MKSIEQLRKFIPSIKGISNSNREGLLHIAGLLEKEANERDEAAKHALVFYADEKRHASSNTPAPDDDLYTDAGEPYMYDVFRDWGNLARQALKTLGK